MSQAPATGEDGARRDALLCQWRDRCVAHLAAHPEQGRRLPALAGVGEAEWARVGIGAAISAIYGSLDEAERDELRALGLYSHRGGYARVLANPGAVWFTRDPREGDRVVGAVRLCPAQGKHYFVGAPAGLGCSAGIHDAAEVVLCDHPGLALELGAASPRPVAFVEDAAVLAPLRDWCAGRTVRLVGIKRASLQAMQRVLDSEDPPAVLQSPLRRNHPARLAELGFAVPEPALTGFHLKILHRFARDRFLQGEGRDLLAALGVTDRDFAEVYQLGFLPGDFWRRLPLDLRRALRRKRLGNGLFIPAFDEQGAVVDGFSLSARTNMSSCGSKLRAVPAGLIAPRVAQSCTEVLIVDRFQAACRHWHAGRRHVLLLRSQADAGHNAERLRRAGVTAAQLDVTDRAEAGIRKALAVAGIAVARWEGEAAAEPTVVIPLEAEEEPPAEAPSAETPPATAAPAPPAPASALAPDPAPPALEFLERDAHAETATFRWGDATLVVDVPWDQASRLEVSLRRSGKVHRDRFDLAVAAQRDRFAGSAARRTGLEADAIAEVLLDVLDEARALADRGVGAAHSARPAPETMDAAARDAALRLARAPDLLARIRADLTALGWVGEETAKAVCFLTALSRKLPTPMWAALRASPGAGKSHGLELIAACTPPEDCWQVSRLTDSALYYQDPGALRHRLMVIDEADALRPEVITALRVLKSRGALSVSHVARDAVSGEARAGFVEVRGPVAVLTSTAAGMEEQLLSRCFDVPVDESPAQTARILAAQRALRAQPGERTVRRDRVLARQRDLQRILACCEVVIPFAERIEFPATSVRHRREQERFLALIEASALLHQHQRLRDAGAVVADLRDFHVAAELMAPLLAQGAPGINRFARELLPVLLHAGITRFTMRDLVALKPEWSRHAFRSAIAELKALDYVRCPGGGRGRQAEYRLLVDPDDPHVCAEEPGIRLRAVGELAEVGEGGSANSTPLEEVG